VPNFYLDIETTGIDPNKCKIITIQFVELDRNTGVKKGELKILKEWLSDEKDILLKFISESKIADPHPFTFVPVGTQTWLRTHFLSRKMQNKWIATN
jgi:hypothetical protein